MHHMDDDTSVTQRVAAAGLGSNVRLLRNDRGWSLDTASQRLGVSRRLLVQVESGAANPSLSSLLAIARGFEVPLAVLLAVPDTPSITVLRSPADAPVLWDGPNGGSGRLLVASAPLELWEFRLNPGESLSSRAHGIGSRETLTVIDGQLELRVGSEEPVGIGAGESAGFHADLDHVYRNQHSAVTIFSLSVFDPSPSASAALSGERR